jgi:ribosomal protein S27AE
MTFKFGGARAQVCNYCRFVVARTDRGLVPTGRMADLLEIPSPFVVSQGGWWGQRRFEVEGRAQYDRVGVASAPWQEILVGFPEDGTSAWIASAQGRWYVTQEMPAVPLPSFEALGPGSHVDLGQYVAWVVQEVGHRKLVSAEGNLTGIPKPGVHTRFADISAQGGRFGTIDYGDGSEAPVLFLGQQFDPAGIKLDSGMPVEQPEAKVKDLQCPNCGGSLPLLSQRAERVVCQYCGTASDVTQGALQALGPSPRPPIDPILPIGAEGVLRGQKMVCCGLVVRSCYVDGMQYPWREYLLWGGNSVGYWWLMEEDGKWSLVTPVETGEVLDSGGSAMYRGGTYAFKQQVEASVDYVVGEFYWKVAIGERVTATELEGPGGKVSREQSAQEVNYSFCAPLDPRELTAFGIPAPSGSAMGTGSSMFSDFGSSGDDDSSSSGGCSGVIGLVVVLVIIAIIIALADCDGGGYIGGGYYSK